MKKHITKFTCDQCEKGIEAEAGMGYPYHENWTYLYNFTFKLAQDGGSESEDQHFCSKECLTKFVNIQLERSFTVLVG